MRFAALIRLEYEADDLADAYDLLSEVLDGGIGIGMITATVVDRRVVHARTSRKATSNKEGMK